MCISVSDELVMSAVRAFVQQLEDDEVVRSHVKLPDARRIVARRAGLSPGTLQRIRNGTRKTLDRTIEDKIRFAFIEHAQKEIQRWEHQIQLAKQSGERPDSSVLMEAMWHISEARRRLTF